MLFLFPAETVHHIVMFMLQVAGRIPGCLNIMDKYFNLPDKKLNREIGGLMFRNPVGLAAGFDKNAIAYSELGALGFGFVEIGTVTPLPQEGNEKPRLFRLPHDNALINRMGFNNAGIIKIASRLKKRRKIIIGGNIGKNKVTGNDKAHLDYLICFEQLYPLVDYFVINISSPNTPGLRELQDKEPLIFLLNAVQEANQSKSIPKPLFLKIAPDLIAPQVDDIIEIAINTGLTGLVVTNTTISRENLKTPASELTLVGAGGLSGKPLFQKSTELVRYISAKAGNRLAIIASGGIFSAADALDKINAGAKLVQLYTGFIYEGPSLVKKINRAILKEKSKVESKLTSM
jgi:dihydroorotate dehydrogenase